MAEEIRHWTLGSDAEGNVQLNIHIEGKHYTIDVHEKDVQSMQNTLDVKALRDQSKIDTGPQRMRVVATITEGNRILATAGDVLTVARDYTRTGQPQVLLNKNYLRICDANSHTAKTKCLAID